MVDIRSTWNVAAELEALGGAGGWPASRGLARHAAVGVAVHRPLRRVPENAMKLVVGVMLSAFGTLWIS